MAYPRVILRSGGVEAFEQMVRTADDANDRYGMPTMREDLRDAPRVVREGRYTTVVVPVVRTVDSFPEPFEMRHVYLVTNYRVEGWKVIDLDCVDERWLRVVAPHYAGVPALGDLLRMGPDAR
jgi:hypothetical protein